MRSLAFALTCLRSTDRKVLGLPNRLALRADFVTPGPAMPKWGLTQDQLQSRPWGLVSELLQPAKTITDPIHGDIYLTVLETLILDSPPLQRLRRVRQLGTTHLVYPGATHSRLSHSLGALRAAQDLMDAVVQQRHAPHPIPDIFQEWSPRPAYDKNVAEATVLARVGALLHDLCHIPFGHSMEDQLSILESHDANEARFKTLWDQLDSEVLSAITPDLKDSLRPLILSKEEDTSHIERLHNSDYAFVADIVGNTICADLLDYLRRDHLYTGLPARLGHRFVESFYVTRSSEPLVKARMVIKITRDRHYREDVVSELLKYLRYRYELSERALDHHAKLAADAMIGKLFELWWDAERHSPSGEQREDSAVKSCLEDLCLKHGDDGLLETILADAEKKAPTDVRYAQIESLARDILERRLFQLLGRCSNRSQAQLVFDRFGSRDKRRLAETEAAKEAGVEFSDLCIWIPDPEMRLKPAEVLVNKDGSISPLNEMDRVGRHRGSEIYESHRALWAVSIFGRRTMDETKARAVLTELKRIMGITWDRPVEPLDNAVLHKLVPSYDTQAEDEACNE